MSDLHEDSPECRILTCGRPVRHEGDACWVHKSLPDPDLEAESELSRHWLNESEYDPSLPSEQEHHDHPEAAW
jgi:hypothetical protein